jgi:ketosteroid isomerase-like protein
MMQGVMGTFEEFLPQPEAFMEAEGDNVVVPVNVHGRAKSGRDFTGRALWLYRLTGGKITRAEVFLDTASARDAVG